MTENTWMAAIVFGGFLATVLLICAGAAIYYYLKERLDINNGKLHRENKKLREENKAFTKELDQLRHRHNLHIDLLTRVHASDAVLPQLPPDLTFRIKEAVDHPLTLPGWPKVSR